ncbi:MAG: Ig-like domain-containing protein, partial [Bacteroidota bacterium]
MHSKSLYPSSYFLIGLLIVLLSAIACNEERQAKKMPTEISSFLYAYTSGTISKSAPIRVRFTNSVTDNQQIGQAVEQNVLTFDPSIDGSAVWEDDRTILFEPEEWLQSRTTYVATVQLAKLFDKVPKSISSFEFDFRTKDQYLDLAVLGLETEDITDLATQTLKGNIYTSDVADAERVEAVLTASQGGTALPI